MEITLTRIADDYDYIAQRLKEFEREKGKVEVEIPYDVPLPEPLGNIVACGNCFGAGCIPHPLGRGMQQICVRCSGKGYIHT